MKVTIVTRWRRLWVRLSGLRGLGRVAAHIAALGTTPLHGRAFLAHLNRRGFVAPSACLAHPDVRRGRHVYLGDRVLMMRLPRGGAIELGDRVQLYGETIVETGSGAQLSLGAGTHVQPGCHFHAHLSDIRIGRQVEIAARCAFYSYNHGLSAGRIIMEQPIESRGPIAVGDGCWFGHGALVLGGVTIGDGAVIGAGAVVTRDLPANAIAAGVPARVLGFRQPGQAAPNRSVLSAATATA